MSASFVATSQPYTSAATGSNAAAMDSSESCASLGLQMGVDSALLLNGQKAVTIVHNGTPYRLQAPKLGKLILTK